MTFRPLFLAFALLAACSTKTVIASAPADTADAAAPSDDDAGTPPDDEDAATSLCAPAPKKSSCGDSAWVRGVAHFDPTHFKAGAKPILRVVLRHEFIQVAGEENIGGRLHMYTNVPITDVASGQQEFALDMCGFGTAMWSEENGMFHLVLIFDENGDNNLDDATSNEDAIVIGTPTMGELVSMTEVDVSCNAAGPCVDVTATCTGGVACTTFTPMKSCTKKTPACKSDSVFCN